MEKTLKILTHLIERLKEEELDTKTKLLATTITPGESRYLEGYATATRFHIELLKLEIEKEVSR